MGVGGGGEGKLYIEFFHEGFCDGGFSRGGGTCNADYLEGEPGGFVFWFRLCHTSSVCATDAIATFLVKGPPENVNIRISQKKG